MSVEAKFVNDVDVRLINHAGGDAQVIAAARVSTQGEDSLDAVSQDPEESAGLIRYLMKNRHGSPFEHGQMTFFIQAPIFVFREFHRHRAGWSYNEQSGRYKELEPVFYVPDSARNLRQVGSPGHYEYVPGSPEEFEALTDGMRWSYEQAYETYQSFLEMGIAREVARMVLPVGICSSMYATCNPRSLMHFLSLRTKDEGALFASYPQREIEMVATRMEAEFARFWPVTYAAFCKFGRVSP